MSGSFIQKNLTLWQDALQKLNDCIDNVSSLLSTNEEEEQYPQYLLTQLKDEEKNMIAISFLVERLENDVDVFKGKLQKSLDDGYYYKNEAGFQQESDQIRTRVRNRLKTSSRKITSLVY